MVHSVNLIALVHNSELETDTHLCTHPIFKGGGNVCGSHGVCVGGELQVMDLVLSEV